MVMEIALSPECVDGAEDKGWGQIGYPRRG